MILEHYLQLRELYFLFSENPIKTMRQNSTELNNLFITDGSRSSSPIPFNEIPQNNNLFITDESRSLSRLFNGSPQNFSHDNDVDSDDDLLNEAFSHVLPDDHSVSENFRNLSELPNNQALSIRGAGSVNSEDTQPLDEPANGGSDDLSNDSSDFEPASPKELSLIDDILNLEAANGCMAVAVSPHLFTFCENGHFESLSNKVDDKALFTVNGEFRISEDSSDEYRSNRMPNNMEITLLPRPNLVQRGTYQVDGDVDPEPVNSLINWFTPGVVDSVISPRMRSILPVAIRNGIRTVHQANLHEQWLISGEFSECVFDLFQSATMAYESFPMVAPWRAAFGLFSFTKLILIDMGVWKNTRDWFSETNVAAANTQATFDLYRNCQEANGSGLSEAIAQMFRVRSLDDFHTLVNFAEMYEFVAFSAIVPGLCMA